MPPIRSYIIDVCATCGRHAIYPFACGHRSETERWTIPITVVPTKAYDALLRRRLEEQHDA